MFILKNKSLFLGLSIVLIVTSIVVTLVFGLERGIDFTGGTKIGVTYTAGVPDQLTLKNSIKEKGLGEAVLEAKEGGYSVKVRNVTDTQRETLLPALSLDGDFPYTEDSFTTVGPSIGKELTQKAILAVIVVIIIIVTFIAFSFRAVSEPVASWKYGLIAISTLAHDIIIPVALFAVLGKVSGAEVDTLFAILTILAISISDTIVVFDRIRENLKLKISGDFETVVGKSLSQSFTRSVNTSLTVVIVLFAIFFFGPETTKNFALVLITGMIVGTYSSIFVASPLLVLVEKRQRASKK
jgi:preprotein translocase subunit SecF